MTGLTLTAVYERTDAGWVQAHIEEIPAVITAAPTLEEAKEMLRDALAEYLLSLKSSPAALTPEGNTDFDREELELKIAS